jgi:hypothetical protein
MKRRFFGSIAAGASIPAGQASGADFSVPRSHQGCLAIGPVHTSGYRAAGRGRRRDSMPAEFLAVARSATIIKSAASCSASKGTARSLISRKRLMVLALQPQPGSLWAWTE